MQDHVRNDLQRGAVFYDLHRRTPALLETFSAEVRDGCGHVLHKRLFVAQAEPDGNLTIRQPTIFLDLSVAPQGTAVPDGMSLPPRDRVETVLYERALLPLLEAERAQRQREVRTISEHLELSLNTLIDRVQLQLAALLDQKELGSREAGLDGRIKMLEDRLDELNNRLEQRKA